MKRIAIFAILPLVAGVLLGHQLRSESRAVPVSAAVPRSVSSISSYRKLAAKLPEDFNILLSVNADQADFALALNVQDDRNFYLISFSNAVEIQQIENGLALPLVSAQMPAELPESYDVLVKRRSRSIVVSVNGVTTAEAYSGTFRQGAAAVSGASPKNARVQQVGEIYFADDFMKGAEKDSQWETVSGTWNVNTLPNSSLSSNAFFFTGRGAAHALSTTGYWFWDNYAFEAACKSEGEEDVGLCFYYRDPANYFLFRWNAYHNAAAPGRKQLVRVANGRSEVVAEQPGGYTINQWYMMEVRVNRQTVRALIDGNEALVVHDAHLAHGKIGLYTAGRMATRFDDVFVCSDKSVSAMPLADNSSGWEHIGGLWRAASTGGVNALTSENAPAGKIITGDDNWQDYTFRASVANWSQGEVGIVVRYLDESNHYLWIARPDGTQQLVRVNNGVRTPLIAARAPMRPGSKHSIFFSADGNLLRAGMDAMPVLEAWDDCIAAGRGGLYTALAGEVNFSGVAISLKQQHEPVLTTNVVFEAEKTMEGWASELSDWLPGSDTASDGATTRTYKMSWHRADFPGDVEISAKIGGQPPAGADLRLVVAANQSSLSSGYSLSVKNSGGLAIEMFRRGQSVGQTTVRPTDPTRVTLSRKGSYVVALANYREVLKFKDETPLDGVTVGLGESGIQLPKEDVQIFCPNVFIYTFDKASSDWRAVSGMWQVTNRWQCDPRWSFFSGVSTSDAIIWSKRLLEGDVTLEFAAAIKMDQTRGGRYEYASDINATICADGTDITSGYSFMFGGWKNTATRILRADHVVAENTSFVIPNKGDIHRRWFYIKICKRGPKIQYFIDNQLILEYEDPEPLAGNRLALWTHNNGIMVAKVRVSCSNAGSRESPEFRPAAIPKTPYAVAQQPQPR